jgi:hypothetical protein
MMAPLPKPTAKLKRVNPNLHVPMTAAQTAMLAARKKRQASPMGRIPTEEEAIAWLEANNARYTAKKG